LHHEQASVWSDKRLNGGALSDVVLTFLGAGMAESASVDLARQSETEDTQATSGVQLDGPTKAAVVLLAVGQQSAAEVLSHLNPLEVQKLSARMASVRALSRELVLEVLREFRETTLMNARVAFDSNAMVHGMLENAFGKERAQNLIGSIEGALDMSGIETLNRLEPKILFDLIRHEHPQIMATVLSVVEPTQASEVVKLFDESERNEVMLRVALLEQVQPAALKELNDVMARAAAMIPDKSQNSVGGIEPVANILNLLKEGADQQVLDEIRKFDEGLAEAISDRMFTFEDLNKLDDRALQTLLLEVSADVLVVALKGASPTLREKIFRNMAKRAAETVRDDLETRGPVRVQDVEQQQREILNIARALAEQGRIMLSQGDGSDFIQ
jgi:flagellar motor switch protein FliG